jgi:hypothetical protein
VDPTSSRDRETERSNYHQNVAVDVVVALVLVLALELPRARSIYWVGSRRWSGVIQRRCHLVAVRDRRAVRFYRVLRYSCRRTRLVYLPLLQYV